MDRERRRRGERRGERGRRKGAGGAETEKILPLPSVCLDIYMHKSAGITHTHTHTKPNKVHHFIPYSMKR